MSPPRDTDFDDWVVSAFGDAGPFTMLFVLLAIGETTVVPLRSAYLHLMGDAVRWPDMTALFGQAGVAWSGAVFFRAGREGLVADVEAKARLASLVRKLHEDRMLIAEGELFNTDGLRLRLEPLLPH